ncbi:MAG: hypothetical protein FD163_2079 [Hyphomonadaceae bacterium]|nr:MAG: hypothetical protein FD128_1087 [Hyphomonadaceae bacterium]KAF0183885.1 MAG: hypothetical protein FD163_2079 [Hyphomonadaceae bacterium]
MLGMAKYKILALLALLALPFVTSPTNAQVSGEERVFAERVAMLTIDGRCNLFTPQQRRALNAFMMQARGSILRAGNDIERLNLIAYQSRNGVASKSCSDPQIIGEAARIKRAYSAWRMQMIAEFPGTSRSWTASRAGVDNWRAWQELGQGARAGFVFAPNGLVFGIEVPTQNIGTARVYLRDARRIGLPRANTNLVPPARSGSNVYNATAFAPAQSKETVHSATRSGVLVIFSNEVTRAIIALDPRDCFEIELVSREGRISRYVVEVGDVIAAFALGAEV